MKVDMTFEDAAKMLRNLAKLTAENTRNWDNYEEICKDVIKSALDAGRTFGQKETQS